MLMLSANDSNSLEMTTDVAILQVSRILFEYTPGSQIHFVTEMMEKSQNLNKTPLSKPWYTCQILLLSDNARIVMASGADWTLESAKMDLLNQLLRRCRASLNVIIKPVMES